ncbi:MAG: LacI family DNA-binding transcriptional regulator [Pseudomonadota bacterium]
MRPTVHDIAREAGVSLATVDRVLNSRAGVRDKTIARVRAAVDRLGYVRDTHAANLARQRAYRFAFVLPEDGGQFVGALRQALSETFAAEIADRIRPKLVSIPSDNPYATVRALQALGAQGYDGVAIMAPETPPVRDAVAALHAAGVVVVTLVSDLPNAPRRHFVGVDSVAAGRTAALLMGRFLADAGEILVAAASLNARDSLERRLGFDAVMARDFPGLTVLPTIELRDDAVRTAAVIGAAAQARPKLVGVYSMGAGVTPLLTALRHSGRLSDLVVIAHELTPTTRAALAGDEIAAVIAQNVGHLVRSALRVLRDLCDERPIFTAQERIRIDVVLRENMS